MPNPKQKFSIGRDRSCDIAIADETISALHAELCFIGDGRVLLTDCKSRNGTFRLMPDGSETRIRQELVSPFDRVRLGELRLSVRELLETLHLKYPRQDPAPPPSAPAPARAVERCANCGNHNPAGARCPICGQ